MIMKIDELRELSRMLESKGWTGIKLRTKIKESSGTFDLIANSKGMLKKTLLLIISSDIYDAQTGMMLLRGVPKKYVKVIFLESGDAAFIEKDKDIQIVTTPDLIPYP